MEEIRIGLVGAGGVARSRHLPALQKIPGVILSSIWSRDVGKAGEVAREFGFQTVRDKWQDVVHSSEVDAVVIATPPPLHLPATLLALEADKHVLCQARMARNLSEARSMAEAAAKSNRITALYPPRPGLKGDRTMQRLLHDECYVGDIREVRMTGMTLFSRGDNYQWLFDPEVMGVNAMTLGMWAEVALRWVGPIGTVSAVGQSHTKQRLSSNGDWVESSVPDSLAVAATLQCGATMSCHFSFDVAGGAGDSLELYGSQGTLIYRFFEEEIQGSRLGQPLARIEVPPHEERQQTTDLEFVTAIRQGGHVSPDFTEGVQYMEFCEAVALSVHAKRTISLPLDEPAMEHWGKPIA